MTAYIIYNHNMIQRFWEKYIEFSNMENLSEIEQSW